MFLTNARQRYSAPIVLVMALVALISPQAHADKSGKKHQKLWQATAYPAPSSPRVEARDKLESGGHVVADKPAAGRKLKTGMKPGTLFKDCRKCPEMVVIPEGSFDPGEEGSAYRATLESFALGKTEVTQGQWKAIMGNNPSRSTDCGANCPVDQVNWNDIQKFILQLNQKSGKKYRLPTAAEWEYACRAGMRQEYCGSDSVDSVAWYKGNSGGKANPVALKQANAFGLYDMSGNAWEWVEDNDPGSDATAATPVVQKQADTQDYYYSSGDDWESGDDDYRGSYSWGTPQGSTRQDDVAKRMLYGGSWLSSPYGVRAARRIRVEPGSRSGNFGFRLARMLP